MAKASGGSAGTFSIQTSTGSSSNPSTPSKQRAKNIASPSSERKHAAVKGESDLALKREVGELGDHESTPTKRSRRASVRPLGMVSYEDGDEGGDEDSSASEFLPEGMKKEEA